MEAAGMQPLGSPAEQRRQQQVQRPADGEEERANAGQGSDQGEEAAAGAAGPPAAAADALPTSPQGTPASHLPPAEQGTAGHAAEPITAEPPRKRVRFSEALEEAPPAGRGLAPAERGMPPLPALPPQLAWAAQGLAFASAGEAGEEEQPYEERGEEGEASQQQQQQLQLLHGLMARARQQQERQQQREASPSLTPWIAALPQQAQQVQHGTSAGVRQAAGQVHGTLVRSLEDLSQLAVQAATGTASPYALVSVNLLHALHRAAQFAVREAQTDLESKLRQQAARAGTVAAAFPPQPAAVAAAAAELRELLSEVQQVARIAGALEPADVPLPPIQHMLEQHTARLQLLLSESLRAAGAALHGSGIGGGDAAAFVPMPDQQAPAGAVGMLAGLFGAAAAQAWQLPQPPQQQQQQLLQPFLQLPGTRPASPAPRMFSDLLPMLLAGQQVEAGQQALMHLVAQRAQQAQQQAQQQALMRLVAQRAQQVPLVQQQQQRQSPPVQQQQQRQSPPVQQQQHEANHVQANGREEPPATG